MARASTSTALSRTTTATRHQLLESTKWMLGHVDMSGYSSPDMFGYLDSQDVTGHICIGQFDSGLRGC
eukprot:7237331-Prymnesium_polylepis.1